MEYFTEILGIGEAVVLGHVADAVVAGAELGGCGIDADVADILCDADAELLLERAAEVGVGNAELGGNGADVDRLVVALREQLERAQHQRTETAADGGLHQLHLQRAERSMIRQRGIALLTEGTGDDRPVIAEKALRLESEERLVFGDNTGRIGKVAEKERGAAVEHRAGFTAELAEGVFDQLKLIADGNGTETEQKAIAENRLLIEERFGIEVAAEPATADDLAIAQDLLDTLAAHKDGCVGMAANMIGVNKRIIVFDNNGDYMVMFNPVIVKKSAPYDAEEGCLSLTGTRKTKRYQTMRRDTPAMRGLSPRRRVRFPAI